MPLVMMSNILGFNAHIFYYYILYRCRTDDDIVDRNEDELHKDLRD